MIDIKIRPEKAIFILLLFWIAACHAGTLTLPEAQRLLFNNNRDVQIAEMRYLKSLVDVTEAKSSYYPTAETFASYSYQSKANRLQVDQELTGIIPMLNPGMEDRPIPLHLDNTVGDFDRFEWGVDISFPLFTGFSRRNSVLAKQASSTVYCHSLASTKDMLSVRLGLLYFQWELSLKKLEVQQAFIDQVSEYVVQMTNLYNSGVEPRSKVLEASARLEASKVELLSAQSAVDSIRLEIIDFLRIADTIDMPKAYPYELSAQVIESRPRPYRTEIVIIDSTLSSLRLSERALLGKRFPQLFVMAGYRVGNPGIIMGGDEFIDWGVAGLQLRWTLYDGQKNWAQREQIRHEIDILRKEREKQLATWEKTAAVYRLQIEKAHRMKTAAELSQKAAEAFAADLKNALSAGMVSPTEYLNALAAASQARFKVAQAETFRKSVSLQLAYALGETIEF